MSFLDKIKNAILPKDTDFLSDLTEMGKSTGLVIDRLCNFLSGANDIEEVAGIYAHIKDSKVLYKEKVHLLNQALITPVDKEALSRVYVDLYWIGLSVKHFLVEMEAYGLPGLPEYQTMNSALLREMEALVEALVSIQLKEYEKALDSVEQVVHEDNLMIKVYAQALNELFQEENIEKIHKTRELLAQLKEIGKRIHTCSNRVLDIVFKMN